MSVNVYGPSGCGKSRNANAMMRHFGLKYLIDDGSDESGNPWNQGDPIPEGTLVLTVDPVLPDALDFYKVMRGMGVEERCDLNDPEIRQDLERDLPEVIKNLSNPFNTDDVVRDLGIYGDTPCWLETAIIVVLESLGCKKIRRAYDKYNTWFEQPLHDSNNQDDPYICLLAPFVGSRTDSFSMQDVHDFMGIDNDRRKNRYLQTRLSKALIDIGCERVDRRTKSPRFIWNPPPTRSKDTEEQDSNN